MSLSSFPLAALVGLAVACTPSPPAVAGDDSGARTAPSTRTDSTVTPDQQDITPLLSSNTSGYTEAAELVLRDEAAVAGAWQTAHGGAPGNPAPRLDLARRMVVLVALGERSSAGYTVRIDGMAREGAGAVVRYTVTTPGPDCMTAQMITSPVAAASVPRVDGPVRFERRTAVAPC